MKCIDFEKMFSAYINNELTPDRRDSVEKHLAGCNKCCDKLSAYRQANQKLAAMRTVPESPDIKATVLEKIKAGIPPRPNHKMLCRTLLIAAPVTAVLLVLLLIQPWTLFNNPESIMAKAYSAIAGVRSYHLDIIKTGDTEEQNYQSEVEFTEPDRYHITETGNEGNQEFILIGDDQYYKGEFKSTIDLKALISTYSSMITRESTLNWLDTLKDIRQLPDETIDGTSCYHYQGNYDYAKNLQRMQEKQAERGVSPISDQEITELAAKLQSLMSRTIDLWVAKDDYLIRKMLINTLKTNNGGEPVSSLVTYEFSDFNQPATIEAPVDTDGNLLSGWFTTAAMETAFNSNIQTSVDNDDPQNRMIIYNITLNNVSGQILTQIDIKIIPVIDDTGKIWTSWSGGFNGEEPYSLQPDESVNYEITYGYDATGVVPETVAEFIDNSGLSVSYMAADGQQMEETVRFEVPNSIYTLPADMPPAIDLTPAGEYQIKEMGASFAGQGVSGKINGKEYLFVQVNTQNSDVAAEPGILIQDIRDKTNPVKVSYINTPENTRFITDIALSDNVLYVSAYDLLWIIDVSDPANPKELAGFAEVKPLTLVISGNYAYVNDDNERISVLNITDPSHPVVTGSLPLADASGMSLNIAGNNLLSWVQDTLYTIDISSPASLKIINQHQFIMPAETADASAATEQSRAHILSTAIEGSKAYVILGNESGTKMLVLDISDPAAPREITLFGLSNRRMTSPLLVSGNRVFLFNLRTIGADRKAKLSVIDVSDPSNPQEVISGTMPNSWSFFEGTHGSSSESFNLIDGYLYWFIGNTPDTPVMEIIDLSDL